MTTMEELYAIRRILVALDCATECLAALEAAMELAERANAEIESLLIEDLNLMRLAELPFARELSLTTGAARQIDLEAVEREFRALADTVRRRLEERAAPRKRPWSFRVVRGWTESELAAAAGEVDLVILGGRMRPLTRHARLGLPPERWTRLSARPILLLPGHFEPVREVTAVVDRPAAAESTIAAATRLRSTLAETGAKGEEAPLTVQCVGATRKAAQETAKRAKEILAERDIPADVRMLVGGATELAAAMRDGEGRLVVVAADSPLVAGEAGASLLDALEGPVLLAK
jgi:nucleotide-binding universal stress UspA family protein